MRRSRLFALGVVVCLLVLAVLGPRVSLLLAARHYLRPQRLTMPVHGLRPSDVRSTWHARRSGGRRYEGVDLFAARGTPVVSASRGVVWRVGDDSLGGRVVTVLGDGPALYYYAHLDSWAPGLRPGLEVSRGTPLGSVGNTGNARTTPPHLHFGVYRVGMWRSKAVDPAPLLRRSR
ncbi:MAG: M23 family metallopeptidase [Myxococcales bacterium]|nr:M23 family metallopeptidase [Myxococcales bacterium]